jgi:threonine/homoserine/homoserine lactone efflux protein
MQEDILVPAFGYLALGFFVGFAVSMPVGAVAVMCARRAFQRGFLAGISPGVGAALADTLFALVAAFGITAVAGTMQAYSEYLQIGGGLLLIVYGWRIVSHADKVPAGPPPSKRNAVQAAMMGLALTLTNPGAVLGFAVLFSLLGDLVPAHGDIPGIFLLVVGVSLGAMAWWSLLAGMIASLRGRMPENWLVQVNRGAGVALMGFGGAILLRLLLRL